MSTIIVESCPLLRRGLQHSLANTKFRVTLTASCLDDVSEEVIGKIATLCILGVNKDWQSLLDSVRRVHEINPTLPIAVLCNQRCSADVNAALAVGAKAVLSTNVTCEALVSYLSLICLGETVVPINVVQTEGKPLEPPARTIRPNGIAIALAGPVEVSAPLELKCVNGHSRGLSKRELAILRHLQHGASNKSIARQLEISEATVKVHIKSVFRKISVNNRTQAAMWASQHLSEIH